MHRFLIFVLIHFRTPPHGRIDFRHIPVVAESLAKELIDVNILYDGLIIAVFSRFFPDIFS